MKQNVQAAANVQQALENLVKTYNLQRYAEELNQEAQQAVKQATSEGKSTPQIGAAAKQAIYNYLQSMERDQIGNNTLGRMKIYKVWGAKVINGNEWLFYPDKNDPSVHVSWVEGTQEVHVKFVVPNQNPVSIYYNQNLAYTRIGANSGPVGNLKTEADSIIQDWATAMRGQTGMREAFQTFDTL